MSGLHGARSTAFLWVSLAVWPGLLGCAEQAKPQENKAADHLRKIAIAFDMAKNKPPQNANDIKPFLKQLSPQQDPDEILRSPNDGEPYEIMWGVHLDRQTELNAIFAHEKKGAEGKRYVITVARLVAQMSDAEFGAATFAKGKK